MQQPQMSVVRAAQAMIGSIPIFAQQLCDSRSITVEFRSDAHTAMTDGKKIILPALPVPTKEEHVEAAEALSDLVRCFIPHEVGHIEFSDFKLIRQAKSDLERQLLNVIEDSRMELEMIKRYPGTRGQLDRGLIRLAGMGWFDAIAADAEPYEALTSYVLFYLRGHLRGTELMVERAELSRDAVVEIFNENFVTRVEILLDSNGQAMKTPNDSFALMKAIMKSVEDEAEKQKEDPQQKDAPGDQPGSDDVDQDQDGTAGSSPGEGDTSDNSSGGSGPGPSATEASEQNAPGGNASGGNAGGADSSNASGNTFKRAMDASDVPSKDLGGIIGNALKRAEGDADAVGMQKALVDSVGPSSQDDTLYPNGLPLDVTPGLQAARSMKTKLKVHLQSMSIQRSHEATKGNRISNRRVSRTGHYDRRLFTRIDEKKGLDTGVFLLGDVSSSMQGARIETLQQALYSTADAMHSIRGVKLGAGVFPGNRMLIPFGSKPAKAKSRMAMPPKGTTPMDTAISWSCRLLMRQRVNRRVLIVLTDGEPDSLLATQAVIAAAEGMGIEVFGIGIQTTSVARLFSSHCVVMAMNELPVAMMAMLKSTLRSQLQAA